MIEFIRDLADLALLANDWNELAEPFKTPLLQYEWISAGADALRSSEQFWIIVNHFQSSISAIAPLVLTKKYGTERFEFLSASTLCEPGGFIYKDEGALKQLLDAIVRIGKPLFLERIRADAPEVSMLQRLGRGKTFLSVTGGTPFIPINTTWDKFEAGMSSNYRNELRRKKKLLEKAGRMNFEMLVPRPEDIEPYLKKFIRVESASWKGKGRKALLFNERLRGFYYSYAKAAAARGIMRICFLKVDAGSIAAALAVEESKRLWILKIGYDEKWKQCAPGILLMHEMIRYAFEQGLEAYEFLGNEEPWIRRWTKQVHPYVTVRVYTYTFQGLLSLGLDAARSIFVKAFKK